MFLSREEKLAIAKADAEEKQYPKLIGSPAQIESGLIIRYQCYFLLTEKGKHQHVTAERFNERSFAEMEYLSAWAAKQDQASFWLDMKSTCDMYSSEIYRYFQDEMLFAPPLQYTERMTKQAVLTPMDIKDPTIIELRVQTGDQLVAEGKGYTPSILISTMRKLKFEHNGRYYVRQLALPQDGSPLDRLAEVGQALYEAGLSIMVLDERVRSKIESGMIMRSCPRWVDYVTSHKDPADSYFEVIWEYNTSIYDELKQITGSRYIKAGESSIQAKAHLQVPLHEIEQLSMVASKNEFLWTDRAQQEAYQIQAISKQLPVIDGIPIPEKSRKVPSTKPEELEIPDIVEIDPDLLELDW